jgi:hypothetical protein
MLVFAASLRAFVTPVEMSTSMAGHQAPAKVPVTSDCPKCSLSSDRPAIPALFWAHRWLPAAVSPDVEPLMTFQRRPPRFSARRARNTIHGIVPTRALL